MLLHRALSLVVAFVGMGGLVSSLVDSSAAGVVVFGLFAVVGLRNLFG